MSGRPDVMAQIFDIAAASARPYQKKFALERLERLRKVLPTAFLAESAEQKLEWIEALDLDLAYVESQIRGIQ